MRRHEPWLVYKKTDSTLRGNIGAELRALHVVFPEREIIYVPAYPSMGRTVRSGRLLVHGLPVHETEFGRDPLNPVLHSDLEAVLEGVPATVVDGECEEDVRDAAHDIASSQQPLIVAGPAAIAGALAACLRLQRNPVPSLPKVRRCLIINGSMNSVSETQVRYAAERGCVGNGWDIFTYAAPGSGLQRAAGLGNCVIEILNQKRYDAIIVFGGDTAFGIHQAFGRSVFHSYAEVVPGVPVSSSAGIFWITKAGGFGEPDLICRLQERLK
jgi:uncharacterized protein YgbK (DUF1537 family)